MKGFQVPEMKKTLGLILAVVLMLGCVFALASCKGEEEPAIYALAAESSPTKIVTLVDYVEADGLHLTGDYIMEIEGNSSIFTFNYQRVRTVEDGAADESHDRIKTVEGVVYFKDGKFSSDGDTWEAEAPSASTIKFDLKAEYLTNVTINESGTLLTAEMTPDNAVKVLGTDLSAAGNVSIHVETNGVSLSRVIITCTTKSGATVTVNTTYTYNPVELVFPSAE